MAFASIERSIEFYALTSSGDTVDDFRTGHERVYDRAAELGVVSRQTADRLKDVFSENRSASYYRDTVANDEQATLLFELAVAMREYVTRFAQRSHECDCGG